jgi:hypothetical protein
MSDSTSTIQDALRAHVAGEIVCAPIKGGGERVECLTPLDYPSGDGITVWIESYPSRYVATDYGESLTGLLAHPPQDHKALQDQAKTISASLGLQFAEGRIMVEASRDGLGDAVWRIATAASLIAQASASFHPRRRQHREESPFVREVEHTLKERHVGVQREFTLAGESGHKHKATLYVPKVEAIVEPISGHWNQVASVYAKFGDLSRANGYRFFSLLDDREGDVEEELARMLVQVSDVVQWTRREEWISRFS